MDEVETNHLGHHVGASMSHAGQALFNVGKDSSYDNNDSKAAAFSLPEVRLRYKTLS